MRRDACPIAALCLVVVVLAAGCGGSAAHSRSTASTASAGLTRVVSVRESCPELPAKHPFVSAPEDSLVQLKQEPPSLIWQTIFVRPDGTGLVTTLVGEISGAHQDPFAFTRGELAHLHRLIAATRSGGRGSPVGRHPGYTYLLHIAGRPSTSLDGTTPTPDGALIRFLNGVMFTYSC